MRSPAGSRAGVHTFVLQPRQWPRLAQLVVQPVRGCLSCCRASGCQGPAPAGELAGDGDAGDDRPSAAFEVTEPAFVQASIPGSAAGSCLRGGFLPAGAHEPDGCCMVGGGAGLLRREASGRGCYRFLLLEHRDRDAPEECPVGDQAQARADHGCGERFQSPIFTARPTAIRMELEKTQPSHDLVD
jgi:hypothetical protein